MTKEKFINIIKPSLEVHSVYQFNQIKAFTDNSLKEVASKNFENDAEKIRYLVETLHNVRDFLVALTTENSLRISLLSQFNKIEEEIELGNGLEEQGKKPEQRLDDLLASDPSN